MAVTNTVKQYLKRYGDYAFGTITFLIVWFAVVKPEAQARAQSEREAVTLVVELKSLVEWFRHEKDFNNERRQHD